MRIPFVLFALALLGAAAPNDLQSAINARVANDPGVAIAVGVVAGGKVSTYFAGTSGTARPLDEHTLFEIGSVTKTFTATALASMVRAHEVALDDPIAKYLPSTVRPPSRDGKPITLLDLAEQRSGLPRLPTNMTGVAGDDPYADYSVDDMYAFLNGYALTRAPGAEYEYSNYGIGLLGQLLANRANESYESLISRTVLGPLGMTDTQFAVDSAPDGPPLAAGHDLSGAPVHAWHFQSVMPAGGMRSSLADMLKYLRCNMGEGPLAPACLFAQMPRTASTTLHQIGLVWENNVATGTISHGGDTFGFHTFVAISKDRRTGVVVLSNGALVSDIAAHVLMPSYPIAVCPSTGSATPANSSAGRYCSALTGFRFDVAKAVGNDLSIRLLPQPALICKRIGPDTCANASVNATFQFLREGGRIVGLYLTQNGQTFGAVRYGPNGPLVAQLPSRFPPEITLDAATLAQYVGTYSASGATFTVTQRGGRMFVQLTGQPAAAVYPSARDRFFYKIVNAQITFVRDGSGAVTALVLLQDGQSLTATRSGGAAPVPKR